MSEFSLKMNICLIELVSVTRPVDLNLKIKHEPFETLVKQRQVRIVDPRKYIG